MLTFHIKLQFIFASAIFYVLSFSDTTYKTLYGKNKWKFFIDILLYLGQYFVPKVFIYHLSPFYSTFNTRNQENIRHYLNTHFSLADSRHSPSKFQEK